MAWQFNFTDVTWLDSGPDSIWLQATRLDPDPKLINCIVTAVFSDLHRKKDRSAALAAITMPGYQITARFSDESCQVMSYQLKYQNNTTMPCHVKQQPARRSMQDVGLCLAWLCLAKLFLEQHFQGIAYLRGIARSCQVRRPCCLFSEVLGPEGVLAKWLSLRPTHSAVAMENATCIVWPFACLANKFIQDDMSRAGGPSCQLDWSWHLDSKL